MDNRHFLCRRLESFFLLSWKTKYFLKFKLSINTDHALHLVFFK